MKPGYEAEFGTLTGSELVAGIKEVVVSTAALQERIQAIGGAISADYVGKNPLVVGVLRGVLFFIADLLRAITIPVEVDFMAVSHYSSETRQTGVVRVQKDLEMPLKDRHVLFVEGVIDTGLTLNYLLKSLRAREPASLEVVVLFDKVSNRLIDIPLKYKGFDLPDRFVVGYGLDYREKYRNLPFVGLLKPELFKKHSH
ncbi:MAG TPA: hypoxanthine phosphoribosyltransferase [Anaerolineaceae bacterium]